MLNKVEIDTSLIPQADVQNLATAFLGFIKGLCEEPDILQEFEMWKKRGEHKKYSL